jgi:dienelactone hydrolase
MDGNYTLRMARPYAAIRRCAALAPVAAVAAACASAALHARGPTSLPVQDEVSFMETDGHRIRVDVYQPAHGRYPAVILLHGSGGIHAIIESQINRYAQALAEKGIIAFVVHYFDYTGDFTANDSVETANYYHWVREVREATTWVLNRPDVRGRQVGLLGHSLGAWLAVGVAAQDPRVSGIVLFGGGLEPFFADSIKRMPHVLMFHGDKDTVVPLSDATHLVEFMRARHMDVQLVVLPGQAHVFSDSAADDALTRAVRFLAPNARRVRTP